MSGPSKSQWEFGELFPTGAARRILTVAELTGQIRRLLEKQIGQVWVSGEVTNFRAQSSGHIYFTLKDTNAQVACVLFRGEAVAHREWIADGQKVLVQGDVTVYEARGQYQLIVRGVELQGVGALQARFDQLKRKLAAEGLFASERKRRLPQFSQRIGLVTSPSGAAIRDVLHVVQRRNPSLEIILAPCRVQGEGAAREIASAIRLLNEFSTAAPGLDLILLTRGGGSLEDLWAFNEETVARAIFESALPVISAVGHEIDFTISDFVADVRAATPSAGAEIITEGVFSSCEFIAQAAGRIRQLAARQLADKLDGLDQFGRRLARVHPRRRINEDLQRLDDLRTGAARCIKIGLGSRSVAAGNLAARLLRVRPLQRLEQRRQLLLQEAQRLREQARHRLRERQDRFGLVSSRLRLLGPEQVLARGYSITTDAATGRLLRESAQAAPGQRLKTRLSQGEIFSRVEPGR